MAAAMIHKESSCGIDLERMRSKLIRIQDKFVNESEHNYLGDLQNYVLFGVAKKFSTKSTDGKNSACVMKPSLNLSRMMS